MKLITDSPALYCTATPIQPAAFTAECLEHRVNGQRGKQKKKNTKIKRQPDRKSLNVCVFNDELITNTNDNTKTGRR